MVCTLRRRRGDMRRHLATCVGCSAAVAQGLVFLGLNPRDFDENPKDFD